MKDTEKKKKRSFENIQHTEVVKESKSKVVFQLFI